MDDDHCSSVVSHGDQDCRNSATDSSLVLTSDGGTHVPVQSIAKLVLHNSVAIAIFCRYRITSNSITPTWY